MRFVNSKERHEARYQRRKAKRIEKRRKRLENNNNPEWVFSYKHMKQAFRNSRSGVRWKSSVQRYENSAGFYIQKDIRNVVSGKYKSKGFHEFILNERGKTRHIRAVTFSERIVQRCFRDYCLEPAVTPSFIYDNGACQTNKGQTFTIKRLRRHLHQFTHRHGIHGYILIFDFKSFFDSIRHDLCKEIIRRYIYDETLLKLSNVFIDAFGERGLGLGSCVSQCLALAVADSIDHYIKDKLGIKYYGRYMDDGYVICESKEKLHEILNALIKMANKLGLTLNIKKTHIIKLTHGFTFMKKRFFISKTGKICQKICHKSISRERRKLKKYKIKVKENIMSYTDVYQAYQSWEAYAKQSKCWNTIKNMRKLYNDLFMNDERFCIYDYM